jgi:hypothetical protein
MKEGELTVEIGAYGDPGIKSLWELRWRIHWKGEMMELPWTFDNVILALARVLGKHV